LDIDEKLCAAIIIGDFVRFGFCFENLLKKEMVLNSSHTIAILADCTTIIENADK